MKRITDKLLLIILITLFSIFTTSCNNIYKTQYDIPYKSGGGIIYGNKYYKITSNTIKYSTLDSASTEMMFLCSDPLCGHNDETCPAYFKLTSGQITMVIDEKESGQNKGYPVFYISSSGTSANNGYQIIKFDSKNNSRKTIVSGIPNQIISIWLFNDEVFYTSSDGDAGTNIYVTNKSGDNPKKLGNNDNALFYLKGVDSDFIYFTDFEGNIYMAPHDLSEKTFIRKSISMSGVFIYDKKLFFADNLETAATISGTNFLGCNIYYMDLNDMNTEPLLAIENVSYIFVPVLFQSNDILFYCLCDNIKLVNNLSYYDEINKKQSTINIFNDGTSTVYSYNISTNEKKKIIDDSGDNLALYWDANDTYFVCNGFPYTLDTMDNHGIQTSLTVFDYIHGTKKLLNYR